MVAVIKNIVISLIIGILSFSQTYGQSSKGDVYYSEFIYGLNKNSSGGLIGGLFGKKAIRRKDRIFRTYGLEIVNLKNPEEIRRSSSATGNMFIFGKTNYLYAFRFQYGRDVIMYTKAPLHGVEIKFVSAIGPTIGLLTPYYIERALNGNFNETITEKYDPENPNHSLYNILGPGGIFEGVVESKVRFGFNAKVGLNFEYGGRKKGMTGFEFGFLVEKYVNKIMLMPTAKNSSFFPTIYCLVFYGRRR